MLNRCYLFLWVFLIAIVFGGSAAIAQPAYPSEPPPEYGPPPGYRPEYHRHYGETRIVRAVYGARGHYVDVTEIVQRFASDGIRFHVSNETFGIDPYKGRTKHLRVTIVRPDGDEFERSWEEGDTVRL
jgi:hypothetical protein